MRVKTNHNLGNPNPNIILSGNINLPFVKQKKMVDNVYSWEYKTKVNAKSGEEEKFKKLSQIIGEPI